MTEKLKLVFTEGCFDNFNGTEEELAAMLADIHQMVEDGTIMDHATPLTLDEAEELEKLLLKKEPRQ